MAFIVPDVKIDFKELISGFTIPIDIRDDLIYCQRTLRQYLKIHQMVTTCLNEKSKASVIKKCVNDVERQICEIGMEQKFLVNRLRRSLEDYYASIKSDNVEIDREIGNAYITRLLSRHIDKVNNVPKPVHVKRRDTERQILSKFGLYDIKRSKENTEVIRISPSITMGINPKQVSLLKPKSERFAQQNNCSIDIKKLNDNDVDIKPVVSRTINTSRLNLLQALNKARNQSLNISAVKSVQIPAPISVAVKNNYETISSSHSSASDDSLDAPVVSPVSSEDPKIEFDEPPTQESFLRTFGLYTLEYSLHLKQRRSKRRRRNVQSNEKSDFHYGKLEMFDKMNKMNKKKKNFLYSPPATRALKKRKIEKDTDVAGPSKVIVLDRSSSSSPDQNLCNECNKTDNLCQCESCNGWFHVKCHRSTYNKQSMKSREKICPTCHGNKVKETPTDEQYQQRGK